LGDVFRSGDSLFTFGEDLRVRTWNGAAEKLTGIPAEEAVGRFCWEVFRGRDRRGSVVCHSGCANARLLRTGWPVRAQHLAVETPTGRRVVAVSSVIVAAGPEPLFLHLLHEAEEGPAAGTGNAASATLSARQLEVLRLLAQGKTAKLIARDLQIAETTARNHIQMILRELRSHSQLEAVAEARRRRLV
jgi:DNA-binding CsgD family transcriptional regulator